MLFSPDLHLLSAMFEVLPEEEGGERLLQAILRLIDRSARTEPIMKACVEMEVCPVYHSPKIGLCPVGPRPA